MIKAIFFDYDGVIVDSFPIVHRVYREICKQLGKECPEDFSEFKKIYGLNSRKMLRNLQFSKEDIDKADVLYNSLIRTFQPPLYTGVREVIITLSKKYALYVISSSPHSDVQNKLNGFGLSAHFKKIIGGDIGPMSKPAKLLELIESEKLRKDEIVMVGDRPNDFIDAEKAGIEKVLLVGYGWGYDSTSIPNFRQQIKVNTPSDIIPAIEAM